jgi:hypothetical protein
LEMESCKLFGYAGLDWIAILSISASQVVSITGMSHGAQSFFVLFWWDWGLNVGLHAYKAGALLFEPCL